MSTPSKFDPNYRAPKGAFFGSLPTSAGTPSSAASSSAQSGQPSNTPSAISSNATKNPARQDKAGGKGKPKALPNTWSPPKSYDPEKFGHPLPGPKPAWGLAMPKDTPDVSRAYRTKDYADEEDRKADKGTERLVFRSQDQAPYTAMGMPWAQNEQSQARFVMSHHDGNMDEEQKEVMLDYQAAREYIRAQKAEKAEKAQQAKLAFDAARQNVLQMSEDDSAEVQKWHHLAMQQAQKSGTINRPASQEPPRVRETGRTRPRFVQLEDESDDEHLTRTSQDNDHEQEAQTEADNVLPAEPDNTQADPDREQLSPRGERSVDVTVLVMERISTDLRDRFGYLVPIIGFIVSVAARIDDAYRSTRPILGDAFNQLLNLLLRGGLVGILLYAVYWIVQVSVSLLLDSPYSVTQDNRPIATSTKLVSKPMTAKVVIESEPESSFQGREYSLMSLFGGWLISLLSGLGYVFDSVLGLIEYVFNGIGSFFVYLLNLFQTGFNGFTSSCADIRSSELFTFDLTGWKPILLCLALAALLYYKSSIVGYIKRQKWIFESAKTAVIQILDFGLKVWDGVNDWIKSAKDKISGRIGTSWAWTKKTVRNIWNGPVRGASGVMWWWCCFLLWSFLMFLAGFGFRDFYDGFQKVTIVASPC